ncbi:MAG: hypothetical protein ABI840_10875 [bacterium]
MENTIGEEDLYKMIDELVNPKEPSDIVKKLNSLTSEFIVYLNIKKTGSIYRKATSYCDWESNEKCISVKYKNSIDFNYNIIEEFLRSLYFISEYKDVISNFQNVMIHKTDNLDDKFRTKIIGVLRDHLMHMLYLYLYDFMESSLIFHEHLFDSGLITIYNNKRNDKKLNISVKINTSDSVFKISFTKNSFDKNKSNYIFIGDVTQAYAVESKMTDDFLKRTIVGFITKLDNAKNKIVNKTFEGWIVISLHNMYEQYFKNNENTIKNYISNLLNNNDYKLVVMFVQSKFSIDHIIIYEFLPRIK